MRENIAHALAANVIRDAGATPGASRGCTQSELASLGAPRSVIHFLQRTLARRAQLEVSEKFSGAFEWFDMSGDHVQAALENLRHVVTDAALFPPDEWPKAVHHAVGTMLDYLIDPVPTLLDFCFAQGTAAVSVGDLRRRAGYFREYPYVVQAVQAYSQKKGDRRISRHELQATLHHVVQQYTSDFSEDDWMRTLEPLFEFVHISGHVDGGLPVAFVVDFLAAHHQPDAARIVEMEARMAKADMISTSTLRRLLGDALATVETEANAVPDAAATETAVPPTAAHTSKDHGSTEPKPLWQQYAEPDAPLWKSFQDRLQSGGAGTGPSADTRPDGKDLAATVQDVLGRSSGQAEHFMATLFRGDHAAFQNVMERLREAASWSDASTIVARDVFKRFDIDIYSADAVAFTNAVEARYTH